MKRLDSNIDRILYDFQSLLKHKPTYQGMIAEIRMMKFKIKPISGDISFINLKDSHFLETIWTMGKLEEMVQKEYSKLNTKGREALFKLFDQLHEKYQDQLNKINLKHEKAGKMSAVEMEIFKDIQTKKFN